MLSFSLFELVIVLFTLAFIVLALTAAMGIGKSQSLTGTGKAVWFLLIFAFPFLGSIVWFLWGQNAQLNHPHYSHTASDMDTHAEQQIRD